MKRQWQANNAAPVRSWEEVKSRLAQKTRGYIYRRLSQLIDNGRPRVALIARIHEEIK